MALFRNNNNNYIRTQTQTHSFFVVLSIQRQSKRLKDIKRTEMRRGKKSAHTESEMDEIGKDH